MSTDEMENQKPIGTRDWYDFIGMLSGILPELHPGGREATETLLKMCRLEAQSRVLDVGCGSGATACLIAKQFGAHVYGIDLSKVMIVKAKDRAQREGLSESLEFRVADVLDLPFEDHWFDTILLESVLTPLAGNKKRAMLEMVRVLRPGGIIGANEGTVDPDLPAELLAVLDEHPAIYGHFTPNKLQSLFQEAGLEVVELRSFHDLDSPKALQGMGCMNMLKFMILVYPKLLWRLLRDPKIRKAQKVDDQLTKLGKQYMGHALIVGRKP